jgi:cholesterol 7-dehydrogenase
MAILSLEIVLPILAVLLYYLYYRKFKFFRIVEELDLNNIRNKLPRGKCPPSYPNGWYRLCRSGELKTGYYEWDFREVKEIKISGRHIAYYRGTDKQVYAVAAYCPHMGANLGVGGQVKFQSCIE